MEVQQVPELPSVAFRAAQEDPKDYQADWPPSAASQASPEDPRDDQADWPASAASPACLEDPRDEEQAQWPPSTASWASLEDPREEQAEWPPSAASWAALEEQGEETAVDPDPVACKLSDTISVQETACRGDSRLSSVLTLPESLDLGEASDNEIPFELPMSSMRDRVIPTPMRDRMMPNRSLAKPSPKLLQELATRGVGEAVYFGSPTDIAGRECTHAVIEKDFRSASHARLVRLQPGHGRFVFKRADVRQEAAIMCALCCMNQRWRRLDVRACGMPVEVITYDICPLSLEAGCLEAVADSWNLRELAQGYSSANRHLRVFEKVHGDRACLDRLAATTVAYLTAGYALGLRDSHDDNIMLRIDGSLFRVDFGYMFGASPALDAPATAVPNAVYVALGEARWKEVVVVCERALMALSGDCGREPPAWDCIRGVPEMALLHDQAFTYAQTLSLEAFRNEVQNAKEWSVSRTAKNRIREVVRFFTETEESGKPVVPDSVRSLAPIRLPSLPFQPGGDGESPTPEAELPDATRNSWGSNSQVRWSFFDDNDETNMISL